MQHSISVFAVIESTTIFPGKMADFYPDSPVMREYFTKVMAAEEKIFGRPRFLPEAVRSLVLRSGDLSRVAMEDLEPALKADGYVVFGASFIQGPLADFLVERQAVNLHMGVSPFYRGNSCNFWAGFDRRFDYVGATIHRLTKGLDSGPILFHALPPIAENPFDLGMLAVRSAQQGLISKWVSGELSRLTPVAQDKTRQLRYTRKKDFTDAVVQEYLHRLPAPRALVEQLQQRDSSKLVATFVTQR